MRRDLFSVGSKKETKVLNQMLDEFEVEKAFPSDNPTYEDPRDVIGESFFFISLNTHNNVQCFTTFILFLIFSYFRGAAQAAS